MIFTLSNQSSMFSTLWPANFQLENVPQSDFFSDYLNVFVLYKMSRVFRNIKTQKKNAFNTLLRILSPPINKKKELFLLNLYGNV